jgi:hypothetical protein
LETINEQRSAITGDDISAYDEVVRRSGILNERIYDESFPSSRHNSNERFSAGKFGKNFNLDRWHRGHFDPMVLTLPNIVFQQVFGRFLWVSFPRGTFVEARHVQEMVLLSL